MTCRKIQFCSAFIGCVALVTLSVYAHGQIPCSPITKAGLLGSLEKRVLSSKELVRELKRCSADFELTSEVENEIREAGKYLGKGRLDDVILAVRDNYRPSQPTRVSRQTPETKAEEPTYLLERDRY